MKILKTAKYKKIAQINMEEGEFCEDCGVSSQQVKLTPVSHQEQEYPGASVWTFTSYYCPQCLKGVTINSTPIQENTRGW